MERIDVKKTSSNGIVIGTAIIYTKEKYEPSDYAVTAEKAKEEQQKLETAILYAQEELAELAQKSEIFDAHLMLVTDDMLKKSIFEKVQDQCINIERALDLVCQEYYEMFLAMDDEYMRERSADIKDIRNRLMRILQRKEEVNLSQLLSPAIIIAEDLAPSDTATMALDKVLGFITQEGGVTSHVSIMAKGMGIPALVGVEGILSKVKSGDEIILDAGKGTIFINPDTETVSKYTQLKEAYEVDLKVLATLEGREAVTVDGHKVFIYANAGSIEDAARAAEHQIRGIGLFRSEFLYMENSHFPTEEEQFEVYKKAAELCSEEVTIRTLDIGGDKSLSYYEFEKEENPFLGWRAIRISLTLKDVFKAQLRAILRASAYGNVRIMYPMIISLEELEEANLVLEECKKELDAEGKAYQKDIKAGIMIETPASVMMVEELAKKAQFFSIGTNDLTQYMLAVDRGNKKIAHMYNSYHPAVIRAINRVIKAAHENGIPVGMCGEFAGDENAAKMLLGMGLDEFSMSISQTNRIKKIILESSMADAKAFAEEVLTKNTATELQALCEA